MTYIELLPHLIQNALITTVPLKPIQPPYPKSYDLNAHCDYYAGAIGHTTKKCWGLKHRVQDFIDDGWLSFKENDPNVGNNPLLKHGGPSIEDLAKCKAAIFVGILKHGMIKGRVMEAGGCGFHSDCTFTGRMCRI
ncbi:hypothetical protein CR513_49544, partial [Mucuna pruriens]